MRRGGRPGPSASTAGGKRPPRKRGRAPEPAGSVDMSPGQYIVRVDRATGEPIEGPIEPAELLVHAHRDRHPVEIAAQFAASRLIDVTGNEGLVKMGLRGIERLGTRVGQTVADLTGNPANLRRVERLLGVTTRDYAFRFREPSQLSEREVKARVAQLQKQARERLAALGKRPRLRVLLTGATGFLGKEFLAQAAEHPHVEQVVCVVRRETIRDRRTKQVLKVLKARERGALLLKRLHLSGKAAARLPFRRGRRRAAGLRDRGAGARAAAPRAHPRRALRGERLLRRPATRARSARTYSAAGTRSRSRSRSSPRPARASSRTWRSRPPTSTAAASARSRRSTRSCSRATSTTTTTSCTKAMASVETDRALVEDGLRVTQLLPSIVIGHARTGNNRGDTKVLNAPINAFGRAQEALAELGREPLDRLRALLMGRIATTFPGDRSAELNLVPVDRVAAGILASLTAPEAIGARIHLATDNRIRTEEIVRIVEQELGVKVRMSDPTLSRNVTLPLYKAVLLAMGDQKLASVVEKLSTIFGVYGEWGQPIHDVGNDVRLLGLSIRRPETAAGFRMLCRHNKYVQEFGKVRDQDEVARRERVWEQAIDAIEYETGRQVAGIPAREFRQLLAERVELASFRPR